ncbi:MAG: ribosome maturation factor RimM [Myxococcota bacterium]|nr:ribosome maturation factor RimM [Myxococcota bacterium]
MRVESATQVEGSRRPEASGRPADSRTARASDDWVAIGQVARAHGLAGALVVVLYGEEADNLRVSECVRLSLGSRGQEFHQSRLSAVPATRGGRARVRLWLDGIASRSQAEPWAGAELAIPARVLQPLPAGEYYWRDLIGLRCRTSAGRALGRIEEIWPTGSNDVLVVRDGPLSFLIPALYEVIEEVDLESGWVSIDPPEGLLEADADAGVDA